MSKISNVLTMIELLSIGKKYSIQELSEKLEVSPRMIRIYKDEIEMAGIYIDTIKGPYGGYVLNQNINVPKRFITPIPLKIKNKSTYNTFNRAIKEKRKCFIEYYSKDKTISKRTIHPYDLIILGNEWGIAAYCELKSEIRHFYINRIKSIKLLENFFN
ncbi:MAG: WYL domain-containing protein [Bacilli bacterium]|jgi:predicted DNA-binding transcriptional regulator YafY|nr:WYL domain-containing protein [Bacilli bacterium]